MELRKICSIALLCAVAGSAIAVPARRGGFVRTAEDGTEKIVFQHGDETFHYITDENGQWLDDNTLQPLSSEAKAAKMQAKGESRLAKARRIKEETGTDRLLAPRGVVILVKPKTADSNGDAFIATGYGLEGGITDAACRRIVDHEMIPHFKENDYLGGVWAGAQMVRDLAIGEYNEEDYVSEDGDDALLGLILFICILALFLFLAHQSNQGNGGNHRNNGDTGTWGGPIIFTSGSDWGRGGSSWGGGGSFGGGGGWGGFGGGSFGGGGGGGSW